MNTESDPTTEGLNDINTITDTVTENQTSPTDPIVTDAVTEEQTSPTDPIEADPIESIKSELIEPTEQITEDEVDSPYDDREVLVVSQLLHVNHINDIEKLKNTPRPVVLKIIQEWVNHVSNNIENKTIVVGSVDEFIEIYSNLFKKYKVQTTVDLANLAYYNRIEFLKQNMAGYKEDFRRVLQERAR